MEVKNMICEINFYKWVGVVIRMIEVKCSIEMMNVLEYKVRDRSFRDNGRVGGRELLKLYIEILELKEII